MKKLVSFEQIVARLAEVLANPILSAEYHTETERYAGICGWAGVMAPLSRPAFLKTFGEKTVLDAESEARKVIRSKAEAYERSQFHAHELEADRHKAEGFPAPVREGMFVWAVSSGMKGDGGYTNEIKYLCEYEECRENPPRLCCIEKVIHVDELPMSRDDCDSLVSDYELTGGDRSDDLTESVDVSHLSKDELATFYTIAAAVVDKSGRWYLADAEGYDYVRYYYSPLTWATMFAPEVEDCRRKMEERKAEEARQKAKEAADRLAAYRERCQKWDHIMEPIKPYEDAKSSCYRAYVESGFLRKSPEAKALKSAELKLNNARRRNILTMAQTAFPGVKFSLKKHDGWGADWTLSWEDGPTEEQFQEDTDLNLFVTYHDAFDGMQDMAYTTQEEHTEFAQKYMGKKSNSINTNREMSETKRNELVAAIYAAVPEADEGKDDCARNNPHDYTSEEANALADAFGLSMGKLFPHHSYTIVYPEEIAHRVFVHSGYYTAPEISTPDQTPTRGKKSRQIEENGTTENNAAPAPGLSLVELPEGGVAVVGENWKDTYFHRREIKAHGCTWNKDAKQWQATAPEAVAAVREWFATQEEEQSPADPSGSTQHDAQKCVAYSAETAGISPNADRKETEETIREHVSHNYEKFHKLKHDDPDRIFLFLCSGFYEAYGRDAPAVSKALSIPEITPICSEAGAYLFRAVRFDANDISKHIPALIRSGNQVTIVD